MIHKMLQFHKKFTIQQLHEVLACLTTKCNFYIAYSGGLDSHVLLHAMAVLKQQYPTINLTAIHVNHNLSINADFWQQHCEQVCLKLQVKYIYKQVYVRENLAKGGSLEAMARKLRYAVFAEIVPKQAVLLTAHQADDQAETLLLHLSRGAGPKGLAAMQQKSYFADDIELIRPLLAFPRAALLKYAKEHDLKWIEDESNFDINFERNFIRHEVLPVMTKHWAGLNAVLVRAAANCAEADWLLTNLAAEDYKFVKGSKENTLSAAKVLKLNLPRQRNLLRFWIKNLNLPLPSLAKILEIQKKLLKCRADAMPLVHWSNVEVRKYRDDIYTMPPLLPHNNNMILPWDLKAPLVLQDGLGVLHCRITAPFNFEPNLITVRFRQGGEKCIPRGNKHHRTLKNLMQLWGVPPWQRDRIPLLYYKEKLIAVIGYCVCDGFDENLEVFRKPETAYKG